MEGRLPLILVMWHFANLISLACSGQPARIDTMCVCIFACLCLRASGPVDATTLADGSSNGIGGREKVKARER